MKVLKKIESIVIYMALAIVLAITSIVGMFELLYYSIDMSYDSAVWIIIVYGVCVTYWSIKKVVFKAIDIIRH